jgi:hypothetical protein
MEKKSCTHSCSPGDYCPGGKCDVNGCYQADQVKPAKTEFKKNGYLYQQIERVGAIALYSQNSLRPGSWVPVAYEVVIFRVRTVNLGINQGAPYEAYPGSEDWGSLGWTFWDLADARAKMAVLVARHKAIN